MDRKNTRPITVGNLTIGGNSHIVIQSMTTTKTKDIKATSQQINELAKYGCELVRVAVVDLEDAQAIKKIKEQISIPIVADIHFDYRLALAAIDSGVDKLRINPGNIGSVDRIEQVVTKCREKNIPIRIGINAGSLEKDLLEKYQTPTAEAMIESAQRHVDILEKLNFFDIIISLKASTIKLTVDAYKMAAKIFPYPLHLGITEAGTSFSGTIKSAIGIGLLLDKNIGSTLRISLSADPIEEIKVAKEILKNFGLYEKPELISCPTCGRIQYDMLGIVDEIEDFLDTIQSNITVAVMGCAVNGPGEARAADIGVAGGRNSAVLFKKGEIVKRIPEDKIVETLKAEILKMI